MVSTDYVKAVASNCFLFGLILGMAGTIEVRAFEKRVTEYRGILMGLASQFLLLPFLGFLVAKSFDIDHVAGITLMITTTSPGGGFSGLFCSLSNADLALSVAMTTVSTIACMGMMPLNVLIYVTSTYGVSVDIPWVNLFLSVGVVIAAVAVGLTLSYLKPGWKTNLNRVGTVCGVLNVFLAASSSSGSDTPFWEHPPLFMLAIGMPCIVGLVISFVISMLILRIPPPQSLAISIECCYQNTALAITIAFSVFKGNDSAYAAGIPLIYGMAEPAIIAPFTLIAWQAGWTYCPSTRSFWDWLTLNWQPRSQNEGEPARSEYSDALWQDEGTNGDGATGVDGLGDREAGAQQKQEGRLPAAEPSKSNCWTAVCGRGTNRKSPQGQQF